MNPVRFQYTHGSENMFIVVHLRRTLHRVTVDMAAAATVVANSSRADMAGMAAAVMLRLREWAEAIRRRSNRAEAIRRRSHRACRPKRCACSKWSIAIALARFRTAN